MNPRVHSNCMEWSKNKGLVIGQQGMGVGDEWDNIGALNEEVGKAFEIRPLAVTPCGLLTASIVPLTTERSSR